MIELIDHANQFLKNYTGKFYSSDYQSLQFFNIIEVEKCRILLIITFGAIYFDWLEVL
jgi:hypothetical protein